MQNSDLFVLDNNKKKMWIHEFMKRMNELSGMYEFMKKMKELSGMYEFLKKNERIIGNVWIHEKNEWIIGKVWIHEIKLMIIGNEWIHEIERKNYRECVNSLKRIFYMINLEPVSLREFTDVGRLIFW